MKNKTTLISIHLSSNDANRIAKINLEFGLPSTEHLNNNAFQFGISKSTILKSTRMRIIVM